LLRLGWINRWGWFGDGREASRLEGARAVMDALQAQVDRIESLSARLEAIQAQADRLEAALGAQSEWAAEARAELLALANSLAVYRQDVEALEAGRSAHASRAPGADQLDVRR